MTYVRRFFILTVSCVFPLAGQTIPFESERWDIAADSSRILDYLGQKALYLKGGYALARNTDFTDGVVECDIAVSGERGFMGVIWRVQDPGNFEHFYIRPHQSGNPDANQYTPEFNGDSGWQLYYGQGYAAPTKYSFDQWIHIKVVVSGSQADIYAGDMSRPAVQVRDLKRELASGKVGLAVGNFAPAYFANFSMTKGKHVLTQAPKRDMHAAPGTIRKWMVSTAFAEDALVGKFQLSEKDKNALSWTAIASEETGITNLARIQGPAKNRNTAFARMTIESDTAQSVMMRFGYSDRVRVYCNDQLLYSGNNNYLSRDYRYLGTIGLFDAVPLPLRKGRNEIWMAVSEDFGGWGIWGVVDVGSSARVVE